MHGKTQPPKPTSIEKGGMPHLDGFFLLCYFGFALITAITTVVIARGG